MRKGLGNTQYGKNLSEISQCTVHSSKLVWDLEIHTVKSRAVDRSPIHFFVIFWVLWRLLTYGFCHGLRTPNKAFFHRNHKLGLWQTIWADKFQGIWGIFGRFISAHFGTVSPLSMFSINQSLILQKTKPLYPNPKYLFGIGI